jgi:polyisoprenoid-binding protein YceI
MRRALLLLFALLAAATLSAQQSRLVLEGSSNVTDWRCSSTTLQLKERGLQIPVATIRCGNRQMERDLFRALRAAQHPSIDFRFTDMNREADHATIRGELSLAGVTRPIEIDAYVQRIAGNHIALHARLPLRMTDFCITPPTALLGIVKAKNELVVSLDLVLGEQP